MIVQPIILAAGRASRMGENKLVAPLAGKPIVAHVAEAVAAAGLPSPIVVLGHDAAAVQGALAGRDVHPVEAADHAEGLSRSLRCGVRAIPQEACAAIILLGDMPFVSPLLLRTLAAGASGDAIIVPRYAGREGNPVLWGRHWFPRLTMLEGDAGARPLLCELSADIRHLDWHDDGIHRDIDTPDALAEARAMPNNRLNPEAPPVRRSLHRNEGNPCR